MRIRKHASSTLLHQLLHASNAATPPTTPASPPLPPPPPPPAAGAPPLTPAPRSHQPERQKQQKTSTELCLLNQSPWDALPLPSLLLLLLPADDAVTPPPQVAAEDPSRDRAVASTAPADVDNSVSSIPAVAAATSSGSGSLLKPSPPKRTAKTLLETARKKSDIYRGDKRRKVTAAAKRLQVKEEVAEKTNDATEKIEANMMVLCKKNDGKGWNCKREAKRPNSLCDYHLSQIRSYYRGSQHHLHPHQQQQKPGAAPVADSFDKQKKVVGKPPRPPRSVKEDQDGPEFYYYSGFGPWRGKKRRAVANAAAGGGGDGSYHPKYSNLTDGKPEEITVEEAEVEDDNVRLDPESIDDVDDSSDDGTGASWINRRKGRKPVKARSLKSLM